MRNPRFITARNLRRMTKPQARRLKGPEGEGGSHEGAGDNQPVNNDENSNSGDSANNTGEEFDAEAFWNGQSSDDAGNPTPGGSAEPKNPGAGTETTDDGGIAEITTQLQNLNFGEFFDDKMTQEINEGNFENFNTRVNQALRSSVQGSLVLNAKIMKTYGDRIIEQLREEMSGMFEGRDDQSQLTTDFPAAKDPRVAPIIQSVYDQALKNTKGNRQQAVKQTKQMIALMATSTGGDLNLNVAPRGEHDVPPTPKTNWLDELMER